VGRKDPLAGAERESESDNGTQVVDGNGGIINPSFSHSLTTDDSVI